MSAVPWIIVAMNVVGAGIMVRFGLPREIPLVGRPDADPILGYIGLMLFVGSIAIRIGLTVTS